MLCLAVHVYQAGSMTPDPSVRVPASMIRTVSRFLPGSLKAKLIAEGVDLDRLVADAEARAEPGVLMEVESGETKIVIAIELKAEAPTRPAQLTDGRGS